jgi:hypothetical protein
MFQAIRLALRCARYSSNETTLAKGLNADDLGARELAVERPSDGLTAVVAGRDPFKLNGFIVLPVGD